MTLKPMPDGKTLPPAPTGFVVVIDGMVAPQAVLGPFATRQEAEAFAEFATAEIDPARVMTLCSPTTELLHWRNAMTEWTKPQ